MLMVFFRALVVSGALRGGALDEVTHEPGLAVFLNGWIAGFYGGIALLAHRPVRRPLRARAGCRRCSSCSWRCCPFSTELGRVGQAPSR